MKGSVLPADRKQSRQGRHKNTIYKEEGVKGKLTSSDLSPYDTKVPQRHDGWRLDM